MIKEIIQKTIAVSILLILTLIAILFITKNNQPVYRITTAQCPQLTDKIDVAELKNCTGGQISDLVQPTGLWVEMQYNCWKLKTPIAEFIRDECDRTGDDYYCKDSRLTTPKQ